MERQQEDPPSIRHRCARVEMFGNHSQDRGSDMQVTTYGVDLAKRMFQVHWVEPDTGSPTRTGSVTEAKLRDLTGASASLRSAATSCDARPVATANRNILPASDRTRCAVSFRPRASTRRRAPSSS